MLMEYHSLFKTIREAVTVNKPKAQEMWQIFEQNVAKILGNIYIQIYPSKDMPPFLPLVPFKADSRASSQPAVAVCCL